MREHYISMNKTENITDFPKLQALQHPLRIKSNLKKNNSHVIQFKNNFYILFNYQNSTNDNKPHLFLYIYLCF